MTTEEKKILFVDLSARLPYGVMVQLPDLFYPSRMVILYTASMSLASA